MNSQSPSASKKVEEKTTDTHRSGFYYALAAYGSWALVPIYYKFLGHVPALEVLTHRILWSPFICIPIALIVKEWKSAAAVFRKPKETLLFVATALLLAVNWYTFVWAVSHGEVLASSLGYFINPMFSVALGAIVLKERLRAVHWLCIGLACAGIAALMIGYGKLPIIPLTLATSFSLYALLRKKSTVGALPGLTVETIVLAPAAVVYAIYLGLQGNGHFSIADPSTSLLLMGSAISTAIPLLWFAKAARRITLTQLGFMQYLSPTGQFLLAAFAFKEPVSTNTMIAFFFVWSALGLYTAEALLNRREKLSA